MFSASVKDALLFSQSSYVLEYTSAEPIASFELPLVCSDVSLAKNTSIKLSDGIVPVTARIAVQGKNVHVVGNFPTNSLESDEVMGEMSLFRGDVLVAKTLVVLRQKIAIEVMPRRWFFI